MTHLEAVASLHIDSACRTEGGWAGSVGRRIRWVRVVSEQLDSGCGLDIPQSRRTIEN